jgi:predicted Na+-dependent transporter
MYSKIRSAVESHFGLTLIVAFACGLFVPGADQLPSILVPYFLAGVIFMSCAKLTLEDLKAIELKSVFGLYVLRFCVFPFVVFGAMGVIYPEFRYAFFLMALLPCGVTLPAVTAILGGNAALGLGATTITSLLAPLSIPLAFSLISDIEMELDTVAMAKTLALIIFLPISFYFLAFRRWAAGKRFVQDNSSFFAVVQIGIVATIIIGSERDFILENWVFVVFAFMSGLVLYASFYALGWFMSPRENMVNRISYTLITGNNNIALGISLAFLYFPAREISVLVACEVSWIMALSLFQFFIKWKGRNERV